MSSGQQSQNAEEQLCSQGGLWHREQVCGLMAANDRNELITIMVNERRIKYEVDGSKIEIVYRISFY